MRASSSSSVIWLAGFTAISWDWGVSRQPPRVFIQKMAAVTHCGPSVVAFAIQTEGMMAIVMIATADGETAMLVAVVAPDTE